MIASKSMIVSAIRCCVGLSEQANQTESERVLLCECVRTHAH